MSRQKLDTHIQDRLAEGEFRLANGSYIGIAERTVELWNDASCGEAFTSKRQDRLDSGLIHATKLNRFREKDYYRVLNQSHDVNDSSDVRILYLIE